MPGTLTTTDALERGREMLNDRPDNLGLDPESVAYRTHAPIIGTHRDADTLTRSNYEVVSADLLERFPSDVTIERFGHWAVGWTELVLVSVTHDDEHATDALVAALEWIDALADYPVADDDHHSDLEWMDAHEYWTSEYGSLVGELLIEALSREGQGVHPDELRHARVESALGAIAHEHANDIRAYERARYVGDGQMTTDGSVVTIPAAPDELVASDLIDHASNDDDRDTLERYAG